MLGLGVALAGIDYAETKRNNVILHIAKYETPQAAPWLKQCSVSDLQNYNQSKEFRRIPCRQSFH
jgi:hypothetical protein